MANTLKKAGKIFFNTFILIACISFLATAYLAFWLSDFIPNKPKLAAQ